MTKPALEWAVAGMTLPGQTESGDRYVIRESPNGVLVGVIDGLGHGGEAAAAAKVAVTTLVTSLVRGGDESVMWMVRRCHDALRPTRGAVMSLASFSLPSSTMSWLGVGNVEGVFLRPLGSERPWRKTLLLRGGIVGGQLPPLHASVLPVVSGDILILATDGVRPGFGNDLFLEDPPQKIADRILATHAKRTDDALVLVARFRGAEG